MMLDAALGATREHWITTTCPDCSKKQRIEVKIPDVRSRVAAIELLLRESLGRVPQAEEAKIARLRGAADVDRLSWDDMRTIFAVHFADEIAAVTKEGGGTLLRERVAALDDDQRQVLREALDEVAVARTAGRRRLAGCGDSLWSKCAYHRGDA
jgi:hypothetical protein